MTPDEQERFDAISAALARLVWRQDELERRLARLEGGARTRQPSSVEPDLVASPVPLADLEAASPAPPPSRPAVTPPPRSGAFETALGLRWVSRVAVVTAVLALAFFFQYAFERRWITETGRVLLGAGAGLLAVLMGERSQRSGAAVYGQALTAAGVSFLYLSVWASYGPYRLLLYPAAFGLMVLTTALAGLLALRYHSGTVGALGLAGGFLTPLLLGGRQETWFVLLYALILGAAGIFIGRRERWEWMQALCLAGAAVLFIGQMPILPGERWGASLFLAAGYALFVAPGWPPVAASAQILAPLTLAGLWTPDTRALWGVLAFTGSTVALAESRRTQMMGAAFAGFWAAWSLWRAQAAPGPGATAGLALFGAYALFLAAPLWSASAGRRVPGPTDLALAILNPGFTFGAAYWWLGRDSGLAGAVAIGMALAEAIAARLMWGIDVRISSLAAGAAWVLLTAAVPIQLAGYRVTMAWSMEAAALAWIAGRLGQRFLFAAAAMFALVCARLALVDSAMYAPGAAYAVLLNPRFLSFAAAAAGFWAAAWWTAAGREALVAFLAGHAVMLWALFLEAAGWAARVAAPENVASVTTASISVIAGTYALGLVAAGAYRPSAASRVLGIGLIGGVVLKLYLYDVWLLRAFYRMAAFAILGALLWAMAYLYSRFRNSIESWWRKS